MPSASPPTPLITHTSRLRWMLRITGFLGTVGAVSVALQRRFAGGACDDNFFTQRDRAFDRRHGVQTCGHVPVAAMDVPEAERSKMVEYRPMPPSDLAAALAALPIAPKDFHLVDLGCGKGRVLIVGQLLAFAKVTGVELSRQLADAAAENVKRSTQTGSTVTNVVHTNVVDFAFPPDPLVLFLFNPFGRSVLQDVLDRLEASLAARPRECWLLYANAVHSDVIDKGARWRRHATGDDWWAVYDFAAECPASGRTPAKGSN